MDKKELQDRTKRFALRIIKLVRALGKDSSGRIIGNQLLRSGTSLAANYRAACRPKSVKDFISKLAIVIEEADETVFWLEILIESGMVKQVLVANLLDEANQLTAIMVATRNSTIKNQKSKSQA
ncbi:MAG TPA: four helix bundle protein [Patescibacteria group bacterium]|nr:four helix bundle protein [Patescibacteria group bacterium]